MSQNDIASEQALEAELVRRIPELLNFDQRFLGFPPMEFFLLLYFGLILTNLFLPFGGIYFVGMFFVGKARAKKPVDWFLFVPYSKLNVRYSYLLPPGKRTFLP